MNKKLKEKDLNDSFYEGPKIKKMAWVSLIFTFFVLGFISNFPLKNIIRSKIVTILGQNVSCPLSYPNPDISFFPLPKVKFSKLLIPSTCTGFSQDLLINDVVVQFWGPSVYPLGFKTKLKSYFQKNLIDLTLILTFKQLVISMEETNLNIKDISSVAGNMPKMTGDLNFTTLIKMSYAGALEYIDAKINSSNLNIPPQNFANFDFPSMGLSLLNINLEQETRNSITVNSLKLGDPNSSPVSADFQGKIHLNQADLEFSNIDLKGSLKLTDEFQETIPLLKLLLKKYPKVGDSYQINIGGTLGMPVPSAND